jgi:hypothetical protein
MPSLCEGEVRKYPVACPRLWYRLELRLIKNSETYDQVWEKEGIYFECFGTQYLIFRRPRMKENETNNAFVRLRGLINYVSPSPAYLEHAHMSAGFHSGVGL